MTDVLNQILQSKGDIAVKAGAGTGKTTALVKVYLKELFSEVDGEFTGVDSIATITFTEKAADEMSERIRSLLTDEIAQLMQSTPLDASLANLAEDDPDWSQDKRLLAHLTRQRQILKSAYISTIHSFCARLLYEFSHMAGVDPMFRIMDENESSELLDSVIHNQILSSVRKGDKGIRRLVRDYRFASRGEFVRGIKEYIHSLVSMSRVWVMGPIDLAAKRNMVLKELKKKRLDAIGKLKSMLAELRGFKDNSLEKKLANAIDDNPQVIDPDIELDLKSASYLFAEGEQRYKGAAKRTKADPEPALEAGSLLMDICGPSIEEYATPVVDALASLMQTTIKTYSQEKDRRAALDFDDLEEKTLNLLKNNPTVLKELKRRFSKVLVDEFQDVNGLQGEIISLLAPPGEGRLFIVGDSKQSIYGFRGSDPSIFAKFTDKIEEIDGAKFALNSNWRSTPSLVNFFNSLFDGVLGQPDINGRVGFDNATDSLSPMLDDGQNGPAVTFLNCGLDENMDTRQSRELEAATIATHMAGLVTSGTMVSNKGEDKAVLLGYGDMAILLRTFTNHEIYENALKKRGIPYQIIRGSGFYDAQEIKDFSNILSFIDYAGDLLSLISTLRSPLVGVSDDGILRLRRMGPDSDKGMVEMILSGDWFPSGLDDVDIYRLEKFSIRITKWRAQRDRVTPSELLETILVETGYASVMMGRFNGEQILANIFKLIEMARLHETEGGGLGGFISRLRVMISKAPVESKADITAGSEEVVKIMTAHQSKGLEFPVVFVADMASRLKSYSDKINLSSLAGFGVSGYDLDDDDWRKGPISQMARGRKADEEEYELRRLLYVVMTRAKELLVLSCGKGNGPWLRWLKEFMPENYEYGSLIEPAVELQMTAQKASTPLVDSLIEGYRPDATREVAKPVREEKRPEVIMTVTDLALFRQCPRRYYYQRILRFDETTKGSGKAKRGKEATAITTGLLAHSFLERASIGRGYDQNGLVDAAKEHFNKLPKDHCQALAKSMGRAFDASPLVDIWDVEPEAIMREAPMALKLMGEKMTLTLRGVADLIWFDGERWMVADYKYSLRPKDELAYLFQVKLYALAIMLAHDMDSLVAAVIYLKEKREVTTSMNFLRDDIGDLRDQALGVARRLVKLEGQPEEVWAKRQGKFCKDHRCPYLKRCGV